MYVLALSDLSRCSKYAAAAGYKPAPQLGRFTHAIRNRATNFLLTYELAALIV